MHLSIDSMPVIPLFLFKLSVSLAAVWCFYQVVLRRLTFYKLNRWYLGGYVLVSFLIAFIDIGPMIPEGPAGEPSVIQYIPTIGGLPAGGVSMGRASVSEHGAGVPVWTVALLILALGAALLLLRSAVRWVSLVRLRRGAQLIEGEGVRIYQVDQPIIPFSFGSAIYINQRLHSEKEWEDIILHEYVHIRQKHTGDILLAELLCILNWYNPFAWLLRHSIRQNLEFIADQQVLDNGVDRKGYQYHLLKVVGEPRFRLANNFNFSSLKKRIIMMNKMRSAKAHLLKLLFLLPLVAVLLLAFRNKYGGMPGHRTTGPISLNVAGIIIVLPDRTPIGGVAVRDEVSGLATKTDERGFYRLRIPAIADSPLRVHLNYYKEGYDSSFTGWSSVAIKETTGVLNLGFVIDSTKPRKGAFMGIPDFSRHPIPAEPGYEDAVQEMNRVFTENDKLQRYMQLQKDHPDIGLFYETEDRRKEIVIHVDGTVEKYGYPGTPGLDELYKKYGEMPGYMATDKPLETPGANPGYLARWAAIGEQAQRDFRTTNPTVRAIIFPGDSRVIAVPASGKPKFYDMDNDADSERAEFERLYGKLPDCVPKSGNNTDVQERKAGMSPRRGAGHQDTVPGAKGSAGGGSGLSRDTPVVTVNAGHLLYIIDGKRMPEGWSFKFINPRMIKSISVYKDKAALEKYGVASADGVIEVTMKDPKADTLQSPVSVHIYAQVKVRGGRDSLERVQDGWDMLAVSQGSGDEPLRVRVHRDSLPQVARYLGGGEPLYLMDGKELTKDSLQQFNPNLIGSITVLRDSASVASFGDKGKYGVIAITTKPKTGGN
jgi:beta-lactamase regulating signal transducer with metallopeptidase domain